MRSLVLLAIVLPSSAFLAGCAGGFDFGMKTSADRPPESAPPTQSQWPAQRLPRPAQDGDSRAMTIQTSDRDRAEAVMLERCPDGFEIEDLDYRDGTTCSRPRYELPRRALLPTARCEAVQDVVVRFRCRAR